VTTGIVLNAAVLAVLVGASWPVLRRLAPAPLIGTGIVLCALTVVFDTVMIRAGLYVFDPGRILGVRLWGAPVEDLAYAVAATVGVPVLWTVLAAQGSRGPGRHGTEQGHEQGSDEGSR
jgi:lycopene cyclase domain-containing protein